MYSVKEKLNHFRQLSSPSAAEADLALLREKSPGNSNLIRYGLASSKNAEDILFDLLDVVTHDEIVRNRREFLAAQEAEEVEQPKEEATTEAAEEAEQPETEKKSTSPKKKSTKK